MQADHDRVDAALATARARGIVAAAGAQAAEDQRDPLFGARALAFIVNHIRAKGKVSGESTTFAAQEEGISPRDARAFGAVYAKAKRMGFIMVVGSCPRVRGNGTGGGSYYAPGPNSDPVPFPQEQASESET